MILLVHTTVLIGQMKPRTTKYKFLSWATQIKSSALNHETQVAEVSRELQKILN